MKRIYRRKNKCCLKTGILEWIENIAGKGKNACYQHFLLYTQCFQKASISRSLKNPDSVVKN